MAKKRVKVRAVTTTTTSVSSNVAATNPLQEEITAPNPTIVNGGGAEATSDIINTSEEGNKEEIPMLVVNNGKVANQEGENSSTIIQEGTEAESVTQNEEKRSSQEEIREVKTVVMKTGDFSMKEKENEKANADEEKLKMAAVEGEVENKGFDKPNLVEEKEDELHGGGDFLEEEEDDDEEGDEEDDDEDDDEDEDQGEGEGEGDDEEEEEEEEPMEIGDEEETGEEVEREEDNVEGTLLVEKTEEKEQEIVEETLLVEKTEKKMEEEKQEKDVEETVLATQPEEKMEANSGVGKKRVRSRSKKVVTKVEDNKMVATVEEGKPKILSKKNVGAKPDDKPETSNKKKTPKKVKSMGLIFMCNSKTKQDCYKYKILGLPESKKDLVQKIYKGMRLFLFDIDLRLMYGIYKAAGPGGYNIQPKAFDSAFPSQVRFTVIEDCLPLAEEKFRSVLKDNYYAKKKFDCQLNSEQVRSLCKLFNADRVSTKFKKPKNVAGAETYPVAERARIVRPRTDGERSSRGKLRRKRVEPESSDLRPRLERARLVRGRAKRSRVDEESIQRERIRRQIEEEEMLDRERIRRQREDEERLDQGRIRRQRLDEESWDTRYLERPVVYERERYASPLPLPSRAYDSSSRGYDPYGTVAETAMYMRAPVVDRRERVPAVDHRDRRILDLDLRRRDEVGIRDPYASYRDYNPPPRMQAAATYLPLASSAPEYRRREEAPAYDYGSSLRPLYRY